MNGDSAGLQIPHFEVVQAHTIRPTRLRVLRAPDDSQVPVAGRRAMRSGQPQKYFNIGIREAESKE
jgi:hypothetical protein